MANIYAHGLRVTQPTSVGMLTTTADIVTQYGVRQSTPTSATIVTTPPAFAGIAALTPKLNGALRAAWPSATGSNGPYSYDIYIKKNTATGLFDPANTRNEGLVGNEVDIFALPDMELLDEGQVYYVGVVARDRLFNLSTSIASLSAISTGVQPSRVLAPGDIPAVVTAIWNAVRTSYSAAGSFGEANQGVLSPTRAGYLDNLQYLTASISTLAQNTDMQTVLNRLSSSRASNLDNIDVLVSSRASQASVDNIQNNTDFVGIVPPALELPDTGSVVYKFYARLYNEVGIPTNADSNIMSVAISTPSGSVVVPTTSMTNTGLGQYEFLYTVYASDPVRPLTVLFTYSVGGIPYSQPRTTEVQEYQSSLDILLSRLTSTRALNLDYLDQSISSVSTLVSGVKTKTDRLGFDGSDRLYAHVVVNDDKINYNLSSAQLTGIVNAIWDEPTLSHAILGTMGRALYDVAYSPISLTPSDYQNIANYIWDEMRSMHTDPGSFGEAHQGVISASRAAKMDNLDVAVSTRAAESTLDNGVADIMFELGTISGQVAGTATPADLASAVAPLATGVQVATVESKVDALLSEMFTVADVWAYATRTLSSAVDVTLDISGLATSSQLASAQAQIIESVAAWKVRLTAAIDPISDIMEVVTWLTKNEAMVLDAEASQVDIYDGDNNLILSVGPDLMVESNGQFKFSRANASVVLLKNKTYTCRVQITRGVQTYFALVPITVF